MITDLIILLLAFLVIFFVNRGCIRLYIDASLPKRKRHKLERSDRTFIEWLLYKQYRDILPTPLLIYYFSIFVTFLISAILIVIFHVTRLKSPMEFLVDNICQIINNWGADANSSALFNLFNFGISM
jgi:hypothetical protein